MALKKYLTLRDSATPATTVNLYPIINYQVRPQIVINNTEYILGNGNRAIDYGIDKKVWTFEIAIQAGLEPDWTSANLTAVQTLYALRTSQTIQLVDNWKASGTVYNVHFYKFEIFQGTESFCDAYRFTLKER